MLSVSVPSLGALSPPAWTVNQAGLSAAIPVSGGLAPYGDLSVTGLPAGVTASLSGNTITLSGTPTAAGAFSSITAAVNDATGAVANANYSITVNAAPALGGLSQGQWEAGQAGYNGAIPVNGGTGPFTVVAQSNLPPGLTATVAGASVVFTGTPTAAGTFGSISVTVQDASGATATGTFSITINPAATLGALSSTAWTVNQPGYSGTIGITGGDGRWAT